MRRLLSVFAVTFLAGITISCAPQMTREQQLDAWYQRCLEYGYHPNTNGIAQCVQQQEIERERALNSRVSGPVFCQSTGFGRGGFATCF